MSCAVAMTARASPSRRGGEPEDGAATLDAAGRLTSRVGRPVSGDVADKTISLIEGALNYRRDRPGSCEGHAPYVLKPFPARTSLTTCVPVTSFLPRVVAIGGYDDRAAFLSLLTRQPPQL